MGCLNKITYHWTAGTSKPCAEDLKHYHFIIDSNGILYNGVFKPEDNINVNDGKYAQHTGGGNTGNIGIAFCGCYVVKNGSVKNSKYPLTRIQLERGFELGAELCKKYNIPITNVQTHYEFGKAHPTTTSAGKIDITYMHPFPLIKKDEYGKFIRDKIRWYLSKL
jgi:N-acetyl-anhydromuramyl-L-alanine amidase AmpD